MMPLIVCVKSCHRDREAGFHDAIRETWGQDLKQTGLAQVMFFMGHHPESTNGTILKRDEVVVDCLDDYISLPHKTRGIAQWAQGKIFSKLFLCDNDTAVNAKALMALPYEIYDYAGHFKGGDSEIGTTFAYKDHLGDYPECHPWASGGMGYFLSHSAVELIADKYPKFWAEDMYVGQTLGSDIMRGNLLCGALPMREATSHYRKSPKDPKFTSDILRRIYRDGGPEKLYKEYDAK